MIKIILILIVINQNNQILLSNKFKIVNNLTFNNKFKVIQKTIYLYNNLLKLIIILYDKIKI